MPIPAQFQLGLELTNIVNPLSQAISAVGSLAVIDAVKKAGSDTITELKLASLIGRHRIDEVMKWHFKEQVAKSDQSIISRYIDIVLESGAGPTVREALKNPALFSMVIQLSALAFSHEEESLANAIVEAIEKIVKESGKDLDMVPDYVSLLGTIRACREQTATFSWAPIFEDVEWKLWRAMQSQQSVEVQDRTVPLRSRNLDFPVLQSFIMWMNSLQSFPEHRMLHLRCRNGVGTVIVWSHHILGLTVMVAQGKTQTRFGKGPTHIFIECYVDRPGACLMDPSAPYEPLFSLVNDLQDPPISHDPRCEAYGYGKRILGAMQPKVSDLNLYSNQVIKRCLNLAWDHRRQPLDFGKEPRSRTSPSDEDIIRASQFIFAMTIVETQVTESIRQPPGSEFKGFCQTPTLNMLVSVILSLSRVCGGDLEHCKGMPLAMDMEINSDLSRILTNDPSLAMVMEINSDLSRNITNDPSFLARTPLTASFETICSLLLGHRYPLDYVKPAVLVSAWGWSVFLGGVDASDPTDAALMTIRVVHGVPSRRGTRRPRIIDGPISSLEGKSMKLARPFAWVANLRHICNATMRLPMVGFHSDAFQAVRVFAWNDEQGQACEARIGFRLLQEMCLASMLLPSCPHDNINDFEEWLSKSRDPAILKIKADAVGDASGAPLPKAPPSHFSMNLKMLYGSPGTGLGESTNLVFIVHKEHLSISTNIFLYTICFYSSANSAARWLRLCNLCQDDPKTWGDIFIRGDGTCYACALKSSLLEQVRKQMRSRLTQNSSLIL